MLNMLANVLLQHVSSYANLVATFFAFLVIMLIFTQRHRKQHTSVKASNRHPIATSLPLPCLPSLPLLGSLPFIVGIRDLRKSDFVFYRFLSQFFMKKSKELGSVFAFYASSTYTVVVNGRKSIYDALVKKAVVFADKKPVLLELYYTNPTLDGVIFLPYDEKLSQRRHLVLTLLRDLGYGKREVEVRIQQQVELFIRRVYEYNGRPFDPLNDLYSSLIGIMLGFLYGRTFERTHPLLEQIKLWVEATNTHLFTLEVLPAFRYTIPFRRYLKRLMEINAKLFNITDVLIDECLQSEQEENFVFKYVKSRGRESAHGELRFILRDLYFGASDTSLITLRWALLMLAEYRQVQERLHQLVDSHYQNKERVPTLDDIARLPYVEATILEVMRIETLVPMSVSHQTLKDTELHGYFIPKGTPVFFNLLSAHMDPDEWENPTEFRPERFISKDGTLMGKERVIAFLLGKRSCLGEQLARQQLFIMLTSILLHFDVCPPEGQSRVNYHRCQSLLSMPSDFKICMKPRGLCHS